MSSRPVATWLCSCLLTVTFGVALPEGTAGAEPRTFPYEAVVRTTEVEVRSGPGQRYYVTGRVRADDRVTVHRHDPGGWYMITPPPGSFSYIDAALVRRTGDTTGVVEAALSETGDAARAIVRIGSESSDDHSYYGRELANGDAVQILGEKLLNTDRGAMRMLKIAPPSHEYRWIKGDFILADGETPRTATLAPETAALSLRNSDPFTAATRPVSTLQDAPALSAATTTAPTGPDKDALADLDLRYLALIRQSPEQWDLEGLVADYEALQSRAAADQREQIEQRLAALESRRAVWTEYQDFVRLTNATAERDAQLAAMQTGVTPVSGEVPAPSAANAAYSVPAAEEPTLGNPQPLPEPIAPSATPVPGTAADSPVPSSAAPANPLTPQLNGAGIVQRMPTGRRGQYVLVLADARGRLLATLNAPPQLGLERYVGQSLGVIGQRFFDPRMRSDVINVRQIVPVQLTP